FVARRFVFPRQLRIGQSMSSNARHGFCKSHRIGNLVCQRVLPIVEAERLLIHIPEKMKRLNGDIGSTKATLQQAPKVLHTLHVNLSINILLQVVHELTLVLRFESKITSELVSH